MSKTPTPSLTVPGTPYQGDHSEMLRAVARMVRAAGRRAGTGDPTDLAELLELRAWVELAIADAVVAQRANFSLGEMADALGVTRQAVHKMHASAVDTLAANEHLTAPRPGA